MQTHYLDVGFAPDLPPSASTPEGRLWASALVLAINDASSGPNTLAYESAMRWLHDTAERHGSVRWVCDMLNIHHDRVIAAIGVKPPRKHLADKVYDHLDPLPMKFLFEELVEHVAPHYTVAWCQQLVNTGVRYKLLKRTKGPRRGLDVLEKIYEHDHEPVRGWSSLKRTTDVVID
jgi:hypothetical protein